MDFKVAKRTRGEGARAIQDEELIAVPIDTKTVLYALDLALRASEGMVASEPAKAQKPRELRLVWERPFEPEPAVNANSDAGCNST